VVPDGFCCGTEGSPAVFFEEMFDFGSQLVHHSLFVFAPVENFSLFVSIGFGEKKADGPFAAAVGEFVSDSTLCRFGAEHALRENHEALMEYFLVGIVPS
jgi:hypothetical protein